MLKLLVWCVLLVVCWPLALLALVLYPVVWLLLLPFRVVGFAVEVCCRSCGQCSRCPRGCWARGRGGETGTWPYDMLTRSGTIAIRSRLAACDGWFSACVEVSTYQTLTPRRMVADKPCTTP